MTTTTDSPRPMSPTTAITPLAAALRATGMMFLFGVVVRYGLGYFDPDLRTWAIAFAAPALGVITYLHAAKRVRTLALTLMIGGLVALVFWAVVLFSAAMPVTRPIEWLFVALILGFPVMAVVIGWRMWSSPTVVDGPVSVPRPPARAP